MPPSRSPAPTRVLPTSVLLSRTLDAFLPTSISVHSHQRKEEGKLAAITPIAAPLRQPIAQNTMEFVPAPAVHRVLCADCGTPIVPNSANLCVACLRNTVDITEGIPKQGTYSRSLLYAVPNPSFSRQQRCKYSCLTVRRLLPPPTIIIIIMLAMPFTFVHAL